MNFGFAIKKEAPLTKSKGHFFEMIFLNDRLNERLCPSAVTPISSDGTSTI